MKTSIAMRAGIGGLLMASMALAAPPLKPLPMTGGQFAALREIERQPENQLVLDTRATYQSDHEKMIEKKIKADDVTTAATFVGYPLAVLAILIAAAPL